MFIVTVWAAFNTVPAMAAPLVIDHATVNLYTNLTDADIARVKSMWFCLAGESHSKGYRLGCQLLASLDSRFQVVAQDGGVAPEAYTTHHLRISPTTWGDATQAGGWTWSYGEEDWFASTSALRATMSGLSYCATNGPGMDVLGFGWCWDMSWHNDVGGGTNTAYGTRWAGSTVGGPDGDLRWGLTAADFPLTANHVCMDTYLDATEQYRNYCRTNAIATKVIFTTGPVDQLSNDERSYQVWLKHEHIRNHVRSTVDGILFDYADILCWDDAGSQNTSSWRDHNGVLQPFPLMAPDNRLDLDGTTTEDGDHIGQRGALRLAKAVWWMLAVLSEPTPQLHVTQDAGALVIRFNGMPQNSYEVLYSDDLPSASWHVLGVVTSDAWGVCQITNAPPPGVERRFFGLTSR